jgi:O-antigen/teichoic acid export membrane protein
MSTRPASAPFSRDLAHYIPAKIVPAGVAFVIVLLLARRLSPDEYGRYARILALTTLIDAVASTWIRQSTLRYYPEFLIARTGIVFQKQVIRVVAMQIAVIGAGTGLTLLVLGHRPIEVGLTVVLLAGLMPFSYLTTLYQSARRTGRYAVASLAQSVAQLGWVLVFVYGAGGGLAPAAMAVAAGHFAAIAGIIAMRRGAGIVLRPGRRTDWTLLRRMLAYGLPMSAWLLCFQVLALANRLIIAWARSPAELGPYALTGDLVHGSMSLLMTPFLQAAHPVIMQLWAAGQDRTQIEALITRVTRYLLLLVTPVFVILLELNQELLALAIGPDLRLEGWVTQVLVGSTVAAGLGLYAHKGLEVAGRTGVMLAVAAGAAVLNLGLSLALVGRFGYQAAAIVTLATYVGYAVAVYWFARAYIRIRVASATLVRVAVAAAGSWMMLWAIRRRALDGQVSLAAAVSLVALTGVVYFSVLLMSGELAPEYRRLIRRGHAKTQPR